MIFFHWHFQNKKKPNIFNLIQISVAPVQQRFSSHGYVSNGFGPPASFNQLPQPEGDWTENHQKKQSKYNAILAAAAVFFAGTFGFVSTKTIKNTFSHIEHCFRFFFAF